MIIVKAPPHRNTIHPSTPIHLLRFIRFMLLVLCLHPDDVVVCVVCSCCACGGHLRGLYVYLYIASIERITTKLFVLFSGKQIIKYP